MSNELNFGLGLSGKFFLTFTNIKTGKKRKLSFKNLILDSGLNRYGSSNAVSAHIGGCLIGSDINEPIPSQTTMSSVLAGSSTLVNTSNAGSNTTVIPYWTKRQWTYRFAAGVGTGDINQIGIGWGVNANGTYSGLFSLARLKDKNNNPITITKLANEVLDVRYELQIILPSSDVTGTAVFEDKTYNFIMRPAKAGSWDSYQPVRYTTATGLFYTGDIGSQLNQPSGTSASGVANTLSASVAGTFYADGTISAGLTNANLSGGIRSILLDFAGHSWQIQFNNALDGSKIPKDSTRVFSLNFRISFGRV